MKSPSRLTIALLLSLLAGCSSAERSYPTKPITIICPWLAGGGTDRVARYWAAALGDALGAPVAVVNKTGGAGAVGHRSGAEARPDGHTLTMITFELATMHHMDIADVTYRDFACILQVNADPAAIVVRRDAPWNTLRELLDHAREHPGGIKMSGTARGGVWDLARAGLMLADEQPVDNIPWIPTQGSAASLLELLAGNIEAVCCSVPEADASLEQLKVLAVMADERLAGYPDIPTAREAGVDWTAFAWRGLAAPRGTPTEVVERLKSVCGDIARSPEYQQFMQDNGFAVEIREGDELLAFLAAQDAQWKEVIERAGFSASRAP